MSYPTAVQNNAPRATEPFDPFDLKNLRLLTPGQSEAPPGKSSAAKMRKHPFTLARPTANHPSGLYCEPRTPLDWVALACRCDGKSANAAWAILTRARVTGKPTVIVNAELLSDLGLKKQAFYDILAKFEKLGLVRVLRPGDPGAKPRQKSNHITILGLFVGRDKNKKLTYFVDGQQLEVSPGKTGNECWHLGDKEFTSQSVVDTKYERYFIGEAEYRLPYHQSLIEKGIWSEDTNGAHGSLG